jgi:integrase/recombinase XerD
MTTSQNLPAHLPDSRPLQLAVAGYLARYKGLSRTHAESDLRAYLSWCTAHRLNPLSATRPQVELYVRWMQEIRRLKPSTVSRRTSVVAGFYRTAVIDGLLEHSPAEHVRRPRVPADSPTLGLTHLQLEALLTAARQSPNQYDFALVCLLGLLGLRIFEATGTNIADVGEEHGHRVLRVVGKGDKAIGGPGVLPGSLRQCGWILLERSGLVLDVSQSDPVISEEGKPAAATAATAP